jgi:hypothetical protein
MSRFNIEFTDEHVKLVGELMEKTGLRTQKDLFENAVALFSWAVKEVARGRMIASVDEENKAYAELHMPALMRVTSNPSPPRGKSGSREKAEVGTEASPRTRQSKFAHAM